MIYTKLFTKQCSFYNDKTAHVIYKKMTKIIKQREYTR